MVEGEILKCYLPKELGDDLKNICHLTILTAQRAGSGVPHITTRVLNFKDFSGPTGEVRCALSS